MRLAIIGFGGMGKYHFECIKASGCMDDPVVYDISAERAALAQSLGLKTLQSEQEIWEDAGIDGVLIATPNDCHYDYAEKAIVRGKAVLLEKPACMDSKSFAKLMSLAEKNEVLLQVHQNRRLDEDYLTVKKAFKDRIAGGVYRIESNVTAANGIPGQWRRYKKCGGGMVLDWGVHLVDQILDLEDSALISVYARLSHVLGEEVDDGFTALMEFEDGLTAEVTVDTNSYFTKPRWNLFSKSGSAVLEGWDSPLLLKQHCETISPIQGIKAGNGFTKTMAPRDNSGIICQEIPRVQAEKQYFYKNFASAFKNHEKQFVSNASVLKTLELLEAIFESDRLNQVIKFS